MLRSRRTSLLVGAGLVLALGLALFAALGQSSRSDAAAPVSKLGRDPDAGLRQADTPGEGRIDAAEAYFSAIRTYPATEIPPNISHAAKLTFEKIAQAGPAIPNQWHLYGPMNGIQPGVTSFSGATNTTASRVTAMVIAPTCVSGNCRIWLGVSGGGVWRTEDALAADPTWTYLTGGIAQNSVGALTLSGNTLYLGTGEANRCGSGCEAGVGVYKSTDGGNSWTKLADSCTSNGTYACVTPGSDAFLGRGISKIVVDPSNPNHIYVGSATAVRGLSHVIGNGGGTRLEPFANDPGLYESTNGGATFTRIWNGNGSSFGVIDVGLDALNPATVYASAFDQGLWRRSAAYDGSSTPYDFRQVFAPRFPGGGVDRTMFAATVKNGKSRLYLTDGTANGGGSGSATAAEFWRTDQADQPASTLLASQSAGVTVPAGNGNPFPATYNAWQRLTSNTTASPYYPTVDFCTGQCWYDSRVYTPAGMPDTVYVIGSYTYGEVPCNWKGVGCGNGRSNGRAVLYSPTAGDPDASAPGTAVNRTFVDLTVDAQDQPASWCALGSNQLAFGGVTAPYQCLWAPDSIHPDQHQIVVNPNNPTQIFEGSDGGVIRTTGTFSDLSGRCNSNERPLLGAASLSNCRRMLSKVPTTLTHINKNLTSLQFINVAINPATPCEVTGGTQDNGTWSNVNPSCDQNSWPQIIYGDGGNAGHDLANPTWRFNEFTSGFSDSNFENADPTKWVITSAPIVNSGEAIAFYWPQVADPNPPSGAHPIFSGAQHVWRTWAFGAGTPGAVPQSTTPNIAFYEANCPEFTVFGGDPNCGDYQKMGGDLTSSTYGSDRTGGSVSWIARNRADHGTLWATTSAGRVFVTHNADVTDPANVTWHRIDNATSPTRFPSAVYPDPSNTGRAWITYSGYNATTPSTPGHVFRVEENGSAPGSGQFTNLKLEDGTKGFPTPTGDGDLPANDIVRDDFTGRLYVATDFGVLTSGGGPTTTGDWKIMAGMPRFMVVHLEIQTSSRVPTCMCQRSIYAATHSQGIWEVDLRGPGGS